MVLEFARDLHVYQTRRGVQLCADSRAVLRTLPADSVDLIVTSPPFALLRQKSYGNESQSEYVAWLGEFGEAAFRVLKPTGSFVLDLGGAYERGRPVRSLYNFRVLLDWCDRIGYRLAEEFFWYNPAKLPSPIEWVNKRKLRAKDAVNTVWWFSKTDDPKADVTKVLVLYSARMETLLKDPDKFIRLKSARRGTTSLRLSASGTLALSPQTFFKSPTPIAIPTTCEPARCSAGQAIRPATRAICRFFISFLTDPGDLVMDIFSGSNTTGRVAEETGRRWIGIESDRQFAALSAVRFMTAWDDRSIETAVTDMENGRAIDIKAGLSLGPASEAPRPVGSLQNQLFE